MDTLNSPILTPDQRLRVFISSTLQELAEEREAARKAIQEIHLTPVMFELGARPHAPRNLYREYLAQSQILLESIGIGTVGLHLKNPFLDWKMNTNFLAICPN